jgi:hypothetical protein
MRLGILVCALALGLGACGGGSTHTIDEGDDDTSGGSTRTATIPENLDGTQWRWVEAHCTEGPLDLAARGYSSTLRIEEEGASVNLTYDSAFVNEGCQQTIVQHVSPPETTGELRMEEVARVAVPSTPECFGQPEAPRPGELRLDGRRLEVLVQRSRWCGGFEVRMVYEPMRLTLLSDEEVARRIAVDYCRGDAEDAASLFAETGSVLEPFTVTQTGDPYRHDGRDAVRTWFGEVFSGTPWRAMRVTNFERSEGGALVMHWEYMDPRLTEPLPGSYSFTIAGGEIFEAQVRLDSLPTVAH